MSQEFTSVQVKEPFELQQQNEKVAEASEARLRVLSVRECLRESASFVSYVVCISFSISIIVSLVGWLWSFAVFTATDELSGVFQDTMEGECSQLSMDDILGLDSKEHLTPFAYWFEGGLVSLFAHTTGLPTMYIIFSMITSCNHLGEKSPKFWRKFAGIVFCLVAVIYSLVLVSQKVKSMPSLPMLVTVLSNVVVIYIWWKYTKATTYVWALGLNLLFVGISASVARTLVFRGFIHANSFSKAIRRAYFSVLKAVVIGPLLLLLKRACKENAALSVSVLQEQYLGMLIVLFATYMSFFGRILQTGGGTFEIVLAMEVCAAFLEVIELHDFIKGLTYIDSMKKVWHRVRCHKAESEDPPPSEGFVKVLSLITLLNMVTEAAGSLVAAAFLLLLRVDFEPSATSFNGWKVVSNALVGYFGEILLSDLPVLFYVCWCSGRKKYAVTLQSLKSAKESFNWQLIMVFVLQLMYGLGSGGRAILKELCPAQDGDTVFLKYCQLCD